MRRLGVHSAAIRALTALALGPLLVVPAAKWHHHTHTHTNAASCDVGCTSCSVPTAPTPEHAPTPLRAPHDNCPICVTFLTAGIALTIPPAALLPLDVLTYIAQAAPRHVTPDAPLLPLQPRAPPLAAQA